MTAMMPDVAFGGLINEDAPYYSRRPGQRNQVHRRISRFGFFAVTPKDEPNLRLLPGRRPGETTVYSVLPAGTWIREGYVKTR